jgi:putative transcriptional regulator
MSKAGAKIIAGLRDALAHAKGEETGARTHVVRVPVIDVKELRAKLGMSQPEFALKFGFSLGTLRGWEQGRRMPDGPARVLLTIIAREPKAVLRALAEAA